MDGGDALSSTFICLPRYGQSGRGIRHDPANHGAAIITVYHEPRDDFSVDIGWIVDCRQSRHHAAAVDSHEINRSIGDEYPAHGVCQMA